MRNSSGSISMSSAIDELWMDDDSSASDRKDDPFNTNSSDDEEDQSTTFHTQSSKEDSLLPQNEGRSKWMVYAVLFLAAVIVSTVTFLFLQREDQHNLEVEFGALSREILKQAQYNAQNMFDELEHLAALMTAHSLDMNCAWPNCTLPLLQERVQQTRLEWVGYAPYVTPEEHEGWERYALEQSTNLNRTIPDQIYSYDPNNLLENDEEYFEPFTNASFNYQIPLWQSAPPASQLVNMDLSTIPVFGHLLWDIKVKKVAQYSRIMDLGFLLGPGYHPERPRGTIYQPVFEDLSAEPEVVGFMMATLTWDRILDDVTVSEQPLLVEIEGTCNALFTYRIHSRHNATTDQTTSHVEFLGYGPQHQHAVLKYKQTADLLHPLNSRPGYPPVQHTHRKTDASHGDAHCTYVMNTYPTPGFRDVYYTSRPVYMTILMVLLFVVAGVAFWLYDRWVQARQSELMTTAQQSHAIVTSLFPQSVGKRLLEEAKQIEEQKAPAKKNKKRPFHNKKNTARLSQVVGQSMSFTQSPARGGKPIAEIFPSATIVFADICGFTAWSSTREPYHVFTLLESLYGAFDKISKKRQVFKIETVGDCYVAVCGLPVEVPDHAVRMARFARDCLQAMKHRLERLEPHLGPDTTELGMRFGLHSGAVTAGVLRGDRARFQLFGDSVNTCARIETTGQRNRVHLSEQTANLLVEAGKESWVIPREDKVEAKGKGLLTTYWLTMDDSLSDDTGRMANNITDSITFDSTVSSGIRGDLSPRDRRLVDWHVELLSQTLKQIQAQRISWGEVNNRADLSYAEAQICKGQGAMILDEVQEVINLPVHDASSCRDFAADAEDCRLSRAVVRELSEFISGIASMYNSENPFHNFDHASHVTMSAGKLLSRITSADSNNGEVHAFGITSDPLTQFAVLLSAICHDAEHPGVPNSTMIAEGSPLASIYQQKSIAEQNSVQIVWDLLMKDSFKNLRAAIYYSEEELKRFRQLLVNAVCATDIMDRDLGAARKARWQKAFAQEISQKKVETARESTDVSTNRKATIVIEHMIQASDVSHTMQHWHIFVRWNQSLFMEMYKAYKDGRAEKDPSEAWYEGELGFFDFYVIPLAKKLKNCGVFGVASDEYLIYAEQNRAEWASKGKQQVQAYLHKYEEIQAKKEQRKSSLPPVEQLKECAPVKSFKQFFNGLSDEISV